MTYSDEKHSDKDLIDWIAEHKAIVQQIKSDDAMIWQISWRDYADDEDDQHSFGTDLRDALNKAINHLRYDDIHPDQR